MCAILRVAALVIGQAAVAQTATSLDATVQSPSLAAPERGSISGQYAKTVFGPGDLARGSFTLNSPLTAPSERGGMGAQIFPSYGLEHPSSEWGLGWSSSLSISRFRLVGSIDYQTDELTGPFGRLVKGTDGYWYPIGLSKLVRVAWSGDVIIAYLSDGKRMTFGGPDHVVTVPGKGTYEWLLASVEGVTGQKTRLDYQANASGRLFLVSAWYGGVGEDFQHRVDLTYESTPFVVKSYTSRKRLDLDRRVRQVHVLTKHAVTGVFEERWRYELGYSGDGLGPAFYLTSIQQVFASGDRPPPQVYSYRSAKTSLREATFARNRKVESLQFGAESIQPDKGAVIDIDQDGLSDIERACDHQLARQTEVGWEYESLGPSGGVADCSSLPSQWNKPRNIASLRGDDRQEVISLVYDMTRLLTTLKATDRSGLTVGSRILANNWELSDHTRLADVDRDRRPDLIRVVSGAFQYRPNTSSGSTISFGVAKSGPLSPAFWPEGVWVHDFNGDGLVDLVARSTFALTVWYGKGNFEFEQVGQAFVFETFTGPLSLADRSVTFVDANKDGLTDVVLTDTLTNTPHLYLNRGSDMVEALVPAFGAMSRFTSAPVVGDFSGSGNTELAYTQMGLAYAVSLDEAGTGLMESADDGKGSVLRFEYGRARPAPGVGRRQTVLTAMTVESSGYDAKRYAFDYQTPRVHTVGKFFLGFDGVTRTDSLGSEAASFSNEDRYSGVFVSSRRHDVKVAGVDAIETRTYEEAVFHGVPWKRAKQTRSGFIDGAGVSTFEETNVVSYANEVCPSVTTHSSASGVLTTSKQFVSPASFGPALSCLWVDAVEEGAHANSAFDFRHETSLRRNEVGLVEEVASVAGASRWVLQTAIYRPSDWQVETVSSPGKGTIRFTYDPATRALSTVEAPDGVVHSADSRDPLSGAILTLRTTRGTLQARQFFVFDGQGRLWKQWDDQGSTSEAKPLSLYGYKFATATQPGAVYAAQLVDAARGSVRETVNLLNAAGEPVVTASRVPEGWSFGGLVTRSKATAETKHHVRPTIAPPADPQALDYPTLLSDAEPVGSEVGSTMGFEPESRTTYHAGVERVLVRTLELSGGLLALTVTENGQNPTRTWMDLGRRTVAFDDEDTNRYVYTYDALGRLRVVTLPDGKTHRVKYDGHGRIWRVERDGVATVENTFDDTTGLPVTRKYFTHAQYQPANALVRTLSFAYDPIGRVTKGTHVGEGGAAKVFTNYYDGATPEAPMARTTLGLLTAVTGAGYEKRFPEYRGDGKPTRRVVKLGDWRTVETTWTYLDGGEVASQTVRVRDGAGAVLSSSSHGYLHDAHGRLQTVTLNGSLLATLGYDENGKPASATFANRDTLALTYDSLTRRPVGSTQRATGYAATTETWMNARGLVDHERLTIGQTALSRAYLHSSRRHLASSSDQQDLYEYGFDEVGLPTSVATNGATKRLAETENTLTAGSVTYGFDGLRRTISRSDAVAPGQMLEFAYGPDGQLASATKEGVTFGFVHDEGGRRLLKLRDGLPVAAYLEEGYLDASGLTERVQVGGRTFGIIKGGAFTTVATDPRGSVMAETTGEARVASPFGQRSVHPGVSAAIEFVEKGYDADLGLVRMGARDYDPETNRFTTPDPLFLEAPGHCVASPVQCNLYGYAGGDPLGHVDPTGLGFLDEKWASVQAAWDDFVHRTSKDAGDEGGRVEGQVQERLLGQHEEQLREAIDGFSWEKENAQKNADSREATERLTAAGMEASKSVVENVVVGKGIGFFGGVLGRVGSGMKGLTSRVYHNLYLRYVRPGAAEAVFRPSWTSSVGWGARKFDDLASIAGKEVGFEANTTPWASMTREQFDRKMAQVGADYALMKEGQVDRVIWFGTETLPTTGLGGMLRQALEDSGIAYWHVPWPW